MNSSLSATQPSLRRTWPAHIAALVGLVLLSLLVLFGGSPALAASATTPIVDDGGEVLAGRAAGADGFLGVTFGIDSQTLAGGPYENQGNSILDLPLFRPTADTTTFWDNYVEELTTAGVDYVAVVVRGFVPGTTAPAGGGDPRILGQLVDAINRRGVADRLKILPFDDTPASWTDKKNQIAHHTGGYDPLFDVGDSTGSGEGGNDYVWQNNLRAFFTVVPDDLRFKLDGRPVIINWSLNDFAFTNQGNGNAAKLLAFIRASARSDFGFDPYIIADQSWPQVDPASTAEIDALHNWFGVPSDGSGNGFTLATFQGEKIGVAVPGFHFVTGSSTMVIDPKHGQTLEQGLAGTVNAGARLTLVEGMTDWAEGAALMRTADGSYAERQVDYPGQRIGILRRYSRTPFPADLRVEGETADAYTDVTEGNTYGAYRGGDIDVERTSDTGGGWNVAAIDDGEALQWSHLPLQGTTDLTVRVASPNTTGRLRFVIDGIAGPIVFVPSTGDWQAYRTLEAGQFAFRAGTYHAVRIEILSGGFNLNRWDAQVVSTPEATSTTTTVR